MKNQEACAFRLRGRVIDKAIRLITPAYLEHLDCINPI